MLTSPILADIFELRQDAWCQEEASQNWFSVQSSLRVYDNYLKLDIDRNDMLRKQELGNFSGGLTANLLIDSLKNTKL